MSISDNEKIKCLECGKYFSFLAPHLNRVHQMNCREYRERWLIPHQQPLASKQHSSRCRENINRRIARGELNPAVQVALMSEAYDKNKGRNVSTLLHRRAAAKTATEHKIWEKSPVVKTVPEALKREAVRRMKDRKQTGETVQAIAADMRLSVSCLYRWQAQTGDNVLDDTEQAHR